MIHQRLLTWLKGVISQEIINVTATSLRMINFNTFENEIISNNLSIIEKGITSSFPDFNHLMYAVVKKHE